MALNNICQAIKLCWEWWYQIIIKTMIIQTVETSKRVERKMLYKPMHATGIESHVPIQHSGFSHRLPILELQNQKRSSDHNNLSCQTEQYQSKSDMSASNLSKMNQELENRTKYFTHHGKYDSRWAQDHYDNFGARSRLEQPMQALSSSRATSAYNYSVNPSQHYRPVTTANLQDRYQYSIPRQQESRALRTRTENELNMSNSYYDFQHDGSEIKNVAMDNAREVKDLVKANVKENVRDAVGNENYQQLSNIKASAVEIKDNVKESVKDVAYDVADTAIVAKDAVVEGANQVKDAAKDTAVTAVKATVGEENFNLMRFIKHSFGQITDNIFGTKPNTTSTSKVTPTLGQKTMAVPILKSESLNEVSPIQYSQKTFTRAPNERFTFFWIYGLILIGFFLVIFQSLK